MGRVGSHLAYEALNTRRDIKIPAYCRQYWRMLYKQKVQNHFKHIILSIHTLYAKN